MSGNGDRRLYVIQVIEAVGGIDDPPATDARPDGLYISDFQWLTPTRAAVMLAANPTEARIFLTPQDALDFWQQTNGSRRPDGELNRPLTAFTIEIVPVKPVWKG